MQTRSRLQYLRTTVTGDYFNRLAVPQTVSASDESGRVTTCDDTIGNVSADKRFYLPNGLLIIHKDSLTPRLNGQKFVIIGGVPVLDKSFSGYPLTYTPEPMTTALLFPASLSPTEKSNYAYQIIGKTQPNAPHVNVPAFVGELKDVPDLIYGWGGSVLKQIAKGHLSWRWGIKPMISDISKMCSFIKAVNNRLAEITFLANGGTLKRRCALSATDTEDVPIHTVVHSNGCLITANRVTTYTTKVWGSAQWKLHSSAIIPPAFDDARRKLAESQMSGISSYGALAAAWELLPWSWFIDWFLRFGDVIAGANQSIPMTWSNLCVMCTSTSRTIYNMKPRVAGNEWATLSGPYYQAETRKARYIGIVPIGAPSPTLTPLIGVKTWSILGSIAALRKH